MNKAILIAIPAAVLVIGGGIVGAAMTGMIEIPGLTPENQKEKSTALYTEEKEANSKPIKKRAPKKEEPIPPNMDKGRKELAELWNEVESPVLAKIVAKWPDDELAFQMRYLDTDKTAEVLSLMEAKRAAKLSKVLQSLGAVEPTVKD